MKFFERILGKRIREIIEIAIILAGYVENGAVTDVIHVAQLLMEIHHEKHRPVNNAFLDSAATLSVPETGALGSKALPPSGE